MLRFGVQGQSSRCCTEHRIAQIPQVHERLGLFLGAKCRVNNITVIYELLALESSKVQIQLEVALQEQYSVELLNGTNLAISQ